MKRFMALVPRFAILALLIMSLSSPAYTASWCENCWEWTEEVTNPGPGTADDDWIPDAQCCIAGHGCPYIPDGAFPAALNVEYCHLVSTDDGGWRCQQNVPLCSSGGGGGWIGGGGDCAIQLGEVCPASCFNCVILYF